MQKGCSADALVQFINSLNGAPYNRLRELLGFEYEFPVMEFIGKAALTVRTIQPDPFAPGSQVKLSVLLPKISKIIPYGFQANSPECIATADFLLRCVRKNLNLRIELLNPSMHVLQRSAVTITDGNIATFHFRASLPGHGRRIDSRGCVNMLYHEPLMMIQNLNSMNFDELSNHVECVKQQLELQGLLSTHGLVAFVRDGAILPRQGGASDFPLDRERSVPFSSPPNLRTSLTLSNGTTFTGMGIPKGVTVITGGGFHGKSTLLRALEVGIYPHVPGDGREFVVCDPNAVKIRAEDRRSVTGVNISSYIRQTPFAGSTVSFSTRDASGSTSQAANIVEALELGCSTLLIDEDTSATNFMVRDELIAALVKSEPIVPFVSRVRELYERFMVSSILVVGGSGQFLHVADTVVNMHEYSPVDATAEARELLSSRPGLCALPPSPSTCLNVIQHKHRKVNWNNSFQCLQANRAIVRANPNTLQFGEENVDISFLEQLVEPYQATYIAEALCAALHAQDRKVLSITEIARLFDHSVSEPNLSSPFTSRFPAGFSSRARPFEIGAALNRLRSLHLHS